MMNPTARLLHLALLAMLLSLPAQGQSAAVLSQARVAYIDGDYPAVVAFLADTELTDANALRLLGQSYQALQQHDDAIATLLRADTTDRRVAFALGRSYERIEEPRRALAYYETALRQDSANVAVVANVGRLYGALRQWDRAIALYDALAQADPTNAFFELQLGSAYRMAGLTDSAIVHLERAHRLDLTSVSATLGLSAVYIGAESFISARRALDRSLDVRPEHPLLWQRRGDVALKEEDFDLAAEAFRNAITYGDDTPLNYRNLGVSLYLGGDMEAAHDTLLVAYQADSTDGMGTFYLAMAKQFNEQWDEALYYFDRAGELMGREILAELMAQVAATYDRMDRDGDAIRTYRLALGLDGTKREILFHLGALYDAFYADKDAAVEQYERFLATVQPGELARQQDYARQRIREIRERQFFDQKPVEPAPAVAPPDSSSGG